MKLRQGVLASNKLPAYGKPEQHRLQHWRISWEKKLYYDIVIRVNEKAKNLYRFVGIKHTIGDHVEVSSIIVVARYVEMGKQVKKKMKMLERNENK
jgi:hypothetical protein